MKTLSLQSKWLQEILPEGFPYPSTTVVSGPGGSGKPLIGYMFASEWLQQGGKVVFLLTSTTYEYFCDTMKMLGTDTAEFNEQIRYIELDLTQKEIVQTAHNYWKANFVLPQVWDQVMEIIHRFSAEVNSDPGVMVSGSALNLLFFSETYQKEIQQHILETIRSEKRETYFLTVNSDAFKELIIPVEEAAKNLMMSRMEKPMQLFLKIIRMQQVAYHHEEVKVPLSQEILRSLREEAEKGKRNLIPGIKKM